MSIVNYSPYEIKNKTIENCNNYFDVPEITFTKCKFETNFYALRNAQSLTFINCQDVTDLRFLENVKELFFVNCKNITDVSPLSKNKYVTFHKCNKIKNFNSLINIEELRIIDCNFTEDNVEILFKPSFVAVNIKKSKAYNNYLAKLLAQ